jgi:hypothetical protein
MKTGLASRIGQCGDAAMKLAATTIERACLNSSLLGPFRNRFAHNCGRINVASVGDLLVHFLVGGTCRCHCLATCIVNQLGIDMSVAAKNRQTRLHGSPMDPLADAKLSSLPLSPDRSFVVHCYSAF